MTETPEEYLDRNDINYIGLYLFGNGNLMWIDDDDYCHLARIIDGEWVELTKGLKCSSVWSHPNGDWGWEDENGCDHEVKQEKEND